MPAQLIELLLLATDLKRYGTIAILKKLSARNILMVFIPRLTVDKHGGMLRVESEKMALFYLGWQILDLIQIVFMQSVLMVCISPTTLEKIGT